MIPRLVEVFIVREMGDEVKFLHPGTEIEIFDGSSGAPLDGAWLESKIRRRLIYREQDGKIHVGYEVSAPWTSSGTTDIDVENFGKTWRLREK